MYCSTLKYEEITNNYSCDRMTVSRVEKEVILCLPFHELCFSEQTFSIIPSTFKPKAQFIVLELRRISSVQRRARNIILAKNRRHYYFSLCPVGLKRLDSMLPITHPRSLPHARHLYEFGVYVCITGLC